MRVIMPLPATDFDPTETSVPWHVLRENGIRVEFATPDGHPGTADVRMVEGHGLGPWKPILRATSNARELYRQMIGSEEFLNPHRWKDVAAEQFQVVILPGGHAQGMKPYLESTVLQNLVAQFIEANKLVAAICHGVVLLARVRRDDGTPYLAGRRATALLASQEMTAYAMTALWLGNYYRTYPQTVQDEVREALGPDGEFLAGPFAVLRDAPDHLDRGFVVEDDNLITARWPGDAFAFADAVLQRLTTLEGRAI